MAKLLVLYLRTHFGARSLSIGAWDAPYARFFVKKCDGDKQHVHPTQLKHF